jgi:glucose/arabinose dehydrogenase
VRDRTRGTILIVLISAAFLQAADSPFTDYHGQAPGTVHKITVNDLPRPFATASSTNNPTIVPRPDGAMPQVPVGFAVDLYVSGLSPRVLRTAPNGDVFVAESGAGRVRILRIADPASAPRVQTYVAGLTQPYGIAFYPPGPSPQFVYVATTTAVYRYPYRNGDLAARGPRETIVQLPGGGHLSRDIAFSLDGRSLFVAVGSNSNNNDDPNNTEKNRANILETTPQGGDLTVYASGLRNPSGIAVDPSTGDLWAAVNERDSLGDNLPPDYVTNVQRGGFYGWPYFYIGPHWDPAHIGKHPELRDEVIVPDVLLQPHDAPLTFTFYDGDQFPASYLGDIFGVSHGSWNRGSRTGYEVIRIRRAFGKSLGEYEDFMTGFVTPAGQVWGRPSGITTTADGALLVADDASGSIWRVRYTLRPN